MGWGGSLKALLAPSWVDGKSGGNAQGVGMERRNQKWVGQEKCGA